MIHDLRQGEMLPRSLFALGDLIYRGVITGCYLSIRIPLPFKMKFDCVMSRRIVYSRAYFWFAWFTYFKQGDGMNEERARAWLWYE